MHLTRHYDNKNHLAQVIILFNSARATVAEACCALMKFLMLRFKICKANIIYNFALGCFFFFCCVFIVLLISGFEVVFAELVRAFL